MLGRHARSGRDLPRRASKKAELIRVPGPSPVLFRHGRRTAIRPPAIGSAKTWYSKSCRGDDAGTPLNKIWSTKSCHPPVRIRTGAECAAASIASRHSHRLEYHPAPLANVDNVLKVAHI